MRLRWDWLAPMITVPYVPTLGPMHPDTVTEAVFADVFAVAGTGRFLTYDKARLWGGPKDEQVLIDAIVCEPRHTLIPTIAQRGSTVRTYCYGHVEPEHAAEITAKARANSGATNGRIISFNPAVTAGTAVGNSVLLSDIREVPFRPVDTGAVHVLGDGRSHLANRFTEFAGEAGEPGLRYLAGRRAKGHDDGPILATVQDGRITGAIGPMRTLTDPRGSTTLAPQYFAVHPDHRSRGHGRTLWRAAMNWGRRHGATYQILQAQPGSPAERLYLAEGLTLLGRIHTTPA